MTASVLVGWSDDRGAKRLMEGGLVRDMFDDLDRKDPVELCSSKLKLDMDV